MISLDATISITDEALEDAGFVTTENIEDIVQEYFDSNEFMTQYDLENAVQESYDELDNRIDELEDKMEEMDDHAVVDVEHLRNHLDVARRSIRLLLEERENSLKQRAKRLFTLTGNTMRKLVRRVHWHMPRR